jgi:DNA-binding NarL/FixJ family response regulator
VIRVAIVDNDCLVSCLLAQRLADEPDEFAVACVAETVDELLAAVPAGGVDVVILDVLLGDRTRLAANADRILAAGLPLLVTSSEPDRAEIHAVIRTRAVSFLSKKDLYADLFGALRRIAAGETVMKRDTMAAAMLGGAPHPPELTPREEDVLRLWATGLPPKAIARRLGIREDGVRGHIRGIREKFGAAGRPVTDPLAVHYAAIDFGFIADPRESGEVP